MFCRYCGRELKEGETCDCRDKKNSWNVPLVFSIFFSVLSVVVFMVLRMMLADETGSGDLLELIIYAIPGGLGILACLMALISFKDRHLWKKSIAVFMIGALLGAGFCISLVVFPGREIAAIENEDPEKTENEKDTEDAGEKVAQESESEVGKLESEKVGAISNIIAQLKEDYKNGKLDYASVKLALKEIDVDSLEEEDMNIVLELQEQSKEDLTERVEKYIEKEQYVEAYKLLAEILEKVPDDGSAEKLQEAYESECLLYLQEKSRTLVEQEKEKEARSLLEEARSYYPYENQIDDLIELLEKWEQESAVTENEYIFADSDKRYLEESELEGMTAQELNYAKNEIYARHGRKFVSAELQEYFGRKSWYEGIIDPKKFDDEYDPEIFNKYERSNINLLKAAEKEAANDENGYDLK